jgi:hypothetical protein
VDYLDENGNMQGTPNYTNPFYIRVWQIVNDSTGTQTKTITVVVGNAAVSAVTGAGISTTLVAVKANF